MTGYKELVRNKTEAGKFSDKTIFTCSSKFEFNDHRASQFLNKFQNRSRK